MGTEVAYGVSSTPDKCQVLTISRKRNPVRYEYVLHGHILQRVDSAKYLGASP